MGDGRGEHLGLLVAGYVMLLLFPIGAVIAGFAVIERRVLHGVVLSFLGTLMAAFYFWAAVNAAG